MAKVKIFESVLSKDEQDFIEETCDQHSIPWFYFKDSSGVDDGSIRDKNYVASGGFQHVLYINEKVNSPFFSERVRFDLIIRNILKSCGVADYRLIRAKLNRTTPIPGYTPHNYCAPHVDFLEPHWVALYYVNDADGDTVFFETMHSLSADFKVTRRVTPQKGKCVLFDGSTYHTQSHPIATQARVNLNINFAIDGLAGPAG